MVHKYPDKSYFSMWRGHGKGRNAEGAMAVMRVLVRVTFREDDNSNLEGNQLYKYMNLIYLF